ncbi:MAG TPA: M23 family metallopeptidase [Deltaproteobacteria bacterium]|nr:M23 family metallopeptidase [Deltaproteobacteria bacterium]
MKKSKLSLLLILLLLNLTFSCAGPQIYREKATGVYHRVKSGETAYSIARVYNISLNELAEINNLKDPALLREGTVLFIPNATEVIEDVMARRGGVVSGTKKDKKSAAPKSAPYVPPQRKADIRQEHKIFIWPVKGEVKAHFGKQPDNTYHNWIKIAAPEGSQVRAAASGTVIFSSNIKDYGETVIIRHEKELTTVYTNLSTRYVKADQGIKQGDMIALVGEKDENETTYINFEIRLKGKAANPLLFLP